MLYPRLASLAVLVGAGLVSFLFYIAANGQATHLGVDVDHATIAIEYIASAVFAFFAYAGAVGVAISFAVLHGETSGKFIWRDNLAGRVCQKMTSGLAVKNEPEDRDEESGYCAVSIYVAALVAAGIFLLGLLGVIAHSAITDFPRFLVVCKGLGFFAAILALVITALVSCIWLGNNYPKTVFTILAVVAICFVGYVTHEQIPTGLKWEDFVVFSGQILIGAAGIFFIVWMKSKLQKLRFYSELCPLMEARKN